MPCWLYHANRYGRYAINHVLILSGEERTCGWSRSRVTDVLCFRSRVNKNWSLLSLVTNPPSCAFCADGKIGRVKLLPRLGPVRRRGTRVGNRDGGERKVRRGGGDIRECWRSMARRACVRLGLRRHVDCPGTHSLHYRRHSAHAFTDNLYRGLA